MRSSVIKLFEPEPAGSERASSLSRFAGLVTLLELVFGFAARSYVRRYSLPFSTACGIYLCFVSQMILAIAPGFEAVRDFVGRLLSGRRKWLLPLLWCLPYCLYAAGTGDWRWSAVGKLVAVGVAVIAVYVVSPVGEAGRGRPAQARAPAPQSAAGSVSDGFMWRDLVVAVLLVATVMSRSLHGIWNVPVNLDFLMRLFLVGVAGWTWTFVRPVPGLGYDLSISARAPRAAAINFAYFAIIAIPLGFWLKFTAWNPRWHGPVAFAIDFLEIFFFIALLEEMFFRGFLQSLLTKSFDDWWKAQALVAVLFGFFHILHAPFPNWRYVLLATIAGWFYGSAFRTGGGLMASALAHATVDTVWRTFFTR